MVVLCVDAVVMCGCDRLLSNFEICNFSNFSLPNFSNLRIS